jgi:hypothetical protein
VRAFEGSAILHKGEGSIGTHPLAVRNDNHSELEVEVGLLTLDRYFHEAQIPVDVIKVGVEGYEPFVLQVDGPLSPVHFVCETTTFILRVSLLCCFGPEVVLTRCIPDVCLTE